MTTVEEFTQQPVTEEGSYRGFPVAWTIESSTSPESQSVAIVYRFGILQQWHGDEGWSAEWPAGYFAEHRAWVIKKNGETNDAAIANLAKCGLWNGDFDALQGACPSGFFVLLSVETETFEGKTRLRANWVNPNADKPQARGFAPADPNLLASLRARFQSKTRSVAGGGRQGGSPPPPPPMAKPAIVAHAAPAANGPTAAPAAPQAAGQSSPSASGSPAPSAPSPTPAIRIGQPTQQAAAAAAPETDLVDGERPPF